MAERIVAQVLRVNNTDFLNCTKIEDISCKNYKIIGTDWFYPYKNSGGGIGYKTTRSGTKPAGGAVKAVRLRDESSGTNYWIPIGDNDTQKVITDACNACCGATPVIPTVTIPTPNVEEQACAIAPSADPTSFQKIATGEPLAAGEKYYPIASRNGVLLTPAPAAAGYTTIGTTRTFLNGSYTGVGTWTQDGQSIIWADTIPFSGAFQIFALTQLAANAGTDQSLVVGTTTTTLTGTAAGQNKVTWSRVSGPNVPTIASPNSLSTSVTGLVAGTYVFRLTATNVAGASITDDVSVVVAAS